MILLLLLVLLSSFLHQNISIKNSIIIHLNKRKILLKNLKNLNLGLISKTSLFILNSILMFLNLHLILLNFKLQFYNMFLSLQSILNIKYHFLLFIILFLLCNDIVSYKIFLLIGNIQLFEQFFLLIGEFIANFMSFVYICLSTHLSTLSVFENNYWLI